MVHKVYRGWSVTAMSSLNGPSYARSPRILLASWMSLGMMVTRLAWMAHRLCPRTTQPSKPRWPPAGHR